MKIVPGATRGEYILEFPSHQKFEEFFLLAEHHGYFVIDSLDLPEDVVFRARAQGSPRSRKIKPRRVCREGNVCRVEIIDRPVPVPQQHKEESPKAADAAVGKSLQEKIRTMPLSERVALAKNGDFHERRILMQENNPKIHEFLLRNIRITESEIAWIAGRAVSPIQTILTIANHRDWMKVESIRTGILTNPKTPVAYIMDRIPILSAADLIKMRRAKFLREDIQAAIKKEMKKRGIHVKEE